MADDRWLEIERELKREARPDPEAVERLLAEIRARHRPSAVLRVWRWLVQPRSIVISPLGALGAAAAVLLLALLIPRPREAGTPAVEERAAVEGVDSLYPVQFVLVAPEAARVSLVGDFNDWDAAVTPLRRSAAGGIWTTVVPLRSGRYLYAFVVDGEQWVPDATAPRGPDDEFGGARSVVLVGEPI